MRIAVIGCGAMGSVYAALMADAGFKVEAVPHIERLVWGRS